MLWINCVYLCSTGSFSNMSGGLVSWPKESTNRIILEYWAFYVVNVFMRALQIHKSLKMLFIVHKRFLPNYVQNYKYTSTKDKMQQQENQIVHHSFNSYFKKMFSSCWHYNQPTWAEKQLRAGQQLLGGTFAWKMSSLFNSIQEGARESKLIWKQLYLHLKS